MDRFPVQLAARRSSGAILVAVAALLIPQVSGARLDDGGWMSRDLDTGVVGDVETVYATTVTDGDQRINQPTCVSQCGSIGCQHEPMTLWAFCADGECAGVDLEDRDCQDSLGVASGDPSCVLCAPPCKWRRPLCGSLGKVGTGDPGGPASASHAPPVASADGTRIFAASANGLVYAYDDAGDLEWMYPALPNPEPLDATFYARPALDEWLDTDECPRRTLYILSHEGDLYAFEAGNVACPNRPAPGTLRWQHHVGDGPFLFEPIVDTHGLPQGCPRLYVGSEDPLGGILALNTCASGGSDPVGNVWRCYWKKGGGGANTDKATLSFKLGGTILEQEGLRILVANALAGTVAINLANPPNVMDCGSSQLAVNNQELWFRKNHDIGSQDERTHRSYPTTTRTTRDPERPAVYITGKGGAVIELRALDGTNPWHEVSDTNYLFPQSAPGLTDLSFVSATASPHSGHVFVGSAKVGQPAGVYKVDPAAPPPSDSPWFDYSPPDGWRTTPKFSELDRRVHIGSARGILYTLDSDGQCGLAEWCWDATQAGELSEMVPVKYAGGRCQELASTELEKTPCCAALAASQIADACPCYDGGDVITCNKTVKIAAPYDQLLTPGEPWKELDFATYEALHDDAVTQVGNQYRVVFVLDYLVGGISDLGAATPGEVMNETTGVLGGTAFCPSPWPCSTAGWFGITDMAPGDNVVRLSLFDDAGNESVVRIRVKGVPQLP